MNTIYLDETDDPVNICYDNVFKAVFTRGTPESQAALSGLVSAITGRSLSVLSITANEPPVYNIRDRQIRFDIPCKAVNGELVNIEMSLNPDTFEMVRLEFLTGKLFTGQDIRGSDKTYDDLKSAYQIAILAKGRFFADDSFLHKFEYYDSDRSIALGGRSRIITVELSKADRSVEKPVGEMGGAEMWAVYFRYLTDRSKRAKINEVIAREEGIAMASKVLITISKDEVERARLMSEYKYELDNQSKLVQAKRETRHEIAGNLTKLGIPVTQIAQATGLSIEDIAKL
ncbi:MAG: Rpn family recombination-promoting nuclease/putative transposase [Spirochaetaceae bacterium]|jgi:predicted transposase/invertase (TIGR01784 family)|nr:Rpn family recombination-promoting nuclease/putative transposase [Spirochaetaceae bacterium]